MSEAKIPAGMRIWYGGDGPPADWDGGPVLLRGGAYAQLKRDSNWRDMASNTSGDIIAYVSSRHPGWTAKGHEWLDNGAPLSVQDEAAESANPHIVIPAGMTPWRGGWAVPDDYDDGPRLLRNGEMGRASRLPILWRWSEDNTRPEQRMFDTIAYTPKLVVPAGDLERRLRDAQQVLDGDQDGFNAIEEAIVRLAHATPPIFAENTKNSDAVPEGWRLVPVEPTQAMLRSVDDEDSDRMVARGRAYSAWSAMLAAAPDHIADAGKAGDAADRLPSASALSEGGAGSGAAQASSVGGGVQRAWDSIATLPPIEFSEAEEAALIAHLSSNATDDDARGWRVYLAARFSRRHECNSLGHILKAHGCTITSRWTKPDCDHVVPVGASRQAADSERQRFALEDVEDIRAANWTISLMEEPRSGTRGGRHIEFGIAQALGHRLTIIGPRETVFHHLPNVEHFESVEAFVASLPAAPHANVEKEAGK